MPFGLQDSDYWSSALTNWWTSQSVRFTPCLLRTVNLVKINQLSGMIFYPALDSHMSRPQRILWLAFRFTIPSAIMVSRHKSHHTLMKTRLLIIDSSSHNAICDTRPLHNYRHFCRQLLHTSAEFILLITCYCLCCHMIFTSKNTDAGFIS